MIFDKDDIIQAVGGPALLEQLGEEAAELAQAALKLARVIRGENPTPTSKEEAMHSLIEEYTDVQLMAYLLDLNFDQDIYDHKYQRMLNRVNNKFSNEG